ncbi:MAG: hypothetical protein LQ347_003496 [Umbilicaria vellea]|nr:MAG: hypothetical protein LQ347_003496 [Umbilicaria vellea]
MSFSYLNTNADGEEDQLPTRVYKHRASLTGGLDKESHIVNPNRLTTLKETKLNLSNADTLHPARANTTTSSRSRRKPPRKYLALGTEAAAIPSTIDAATSEYRMHLLIFERRIATFKLREANEEVCRNVPTFLPESRPLLDAYWTKTTLFLELVDDAFCEIPPQQTSSSGVSVHMA